MLNIILATYNESQNIIPAISMTINTLEQLAIPFLIIVVDANSPDGTAALVKNLNDPRVMVINESKKAGLANAYITALPHCSFPCTAILDADLQHDPAAIAQMFQAFASEKCDVATGTRYSQGGMVGNLSFWRRFVSSLANNLARYVLGVRASDLTGSFRCYRTDLLRELLSTTVSQGFGVQMELMARAEKKGCRVVETPIIFYDRQAGESKFGAGEIFQFLKTLAILYVSL